MRNGGASTPVRPSAKTIWFSTRPGQGRLLGFTYGVRVRDDAARWSHGGADNIYIDGEQNPAFLRGSGGEDTFGVGGGGVLHKPDTTLYQGMPYYEHEDLGPCQSLPESGGLPFL